MSEVNYTPVQSHACGRYEVIMKRKGKAGAIRVITYADAHGHEGFQTVVRCIDGTRTMSTAEAIMRGEVERVRAIVDAERAAEALTAAVNLKRATA